MGSVFLSALAALITGMYLWSRNKDRHNEDLVFVLFASPVIAGLLAVLLAMFIGLALPKTQVANSPVYLHGLYDDTGLSGQFFLGSGYVGTEKVYHYLFLDTENAAIGRNVPSEQQIPLVRTFEDELEHPYLVTYRTEFTQMWMGFFALLIHPEREVQYDFHVPPDSIDGNYTIR